MGDPPRDWDKELAEIDKLLAQGPAASPPAQAERSTAPAPRPPAPATSSSRRQVAGIWARAVAGVVLAAAMTQWPYAHACGVPLMLYSGATVAVMVAGIWGAVASWRGRIAAAHTVSLLVTAWGIGLMATVVLPRIGYAAEQVGWWCP